MYHLIPIHIEATTLGDAWFQTVYKCIELGNTIGIDRGSYTGEKRLQFDYITIHIKYPGHSPLLPKIPVHYNIPDPVKDDYLNNYMPYLMTGELKEGESYTYGQRMCEYPITSKVGNIEKDEFKGVDIRNWVKENVLSKKEDILVQEKEIWDNRSIIVDKGKELCLNQIELLIWTYKNKGHENNQMVLQIAHPTDSLLQDPPCLREIDTKISNGKLHFFPRFRSWDLWGGFPANLAGIQMVKEYMAERIGVDDGEMVCSSKGLHLYNYVWKLAEIIRGKSIDDFRKGT